MHSLYQESLSNTELSFEWEAKIATDYEFSIFQTSAILPFYFQQCEYIILIMIKRFAISLFNLQRQTPRFLFSQKKQTSNEQKTVNQNNRQKIDHDNDYDDAQPQFQKQDRTTPGWMLYRFLFWGSSAILGYNIYLVSQHTKKTPVEEQKGAIPGFITAAKFIYDNYTNATQFLTKPPLQKLLPDVLHPQMQPKTLILNLSGTLLNTEYVFGQGLILHKRPGLQHFLKTMSQLYQVVIFSDDDSMLLQTLIPSLDPRRQIFASCFGHECMVFSRGHYIKDLKYLNRDLKKVIVIDKSKNVVEKQKQNVIALGLYQGDQSDRQLIALTGLLQSLAKPEVKDVRKALQELGENPIKKYEQIMKEKQQKVKKNKGNKIFGFFEKKN